MRIARNLRLSLHALAAHPLRASLAITGCAVGVGGVLVLTAVGEGARAAVIGRIESLGPDLLVVLPAPTAPQAGAARSGAAVNKLLRVADAEAIARGAPAVLRAAPAHDRVLVAKYGAIASPATVLGTTPAWQLIRQFDLTAGRFFTPAENAGRARVAVIGAEVRANLFPDSVDPIGRTIRLGNGRIPFEVVGVLVSKGMNVTGSGTEDDRIVIPLETALRRVFNVEYLELIYVQARNTAALTDAEEQTGAILEARHDVSTNARGDLMVQNQRLLLAAELAAQTSFQRLVVGLGFIALIVSGVGILSIMLLSVRERRREIGLRVAVGARRLDVMAQFVAESLFLAVAGGALGVVFGLGTAQLVAAFTEWPARVSGLALAVAISSAVITGIGCGVLPAWRAATLDPIDALHAE